MAGYSFPTDVEDGHQVKLENGVTYQLNADLGRWDVVKGTAEELLENSIGELEDQVQQGLDDQAKIAAKVEELAVTKGAVARYVVTDTSISNVASRNGELYVSSPNAADVTNISFAPFDSNGQTTKPCNPDALSLIHI